MKPENHKKKKNLYHQTVAVLFTVWLRIFLCSFITFQLCVFLCSQLENIKDSRTLWHGAAAHGVLWCPAGWRPVPYAV